MIDALASEDENKLVIEMAYRVLPTCVGEGSHCLDLPKVILYVVDLAVPQAFKLTAALVLIAHATKDVNLAIVVMHRVVAPSI